MLKARSRVFAGLPPYGPGQRIGLMGGTFDPPHAAHRLISLMALQRLRLDVIWWLVTPGNPLKDTGRLPPPDVRMAAAARTANHPSIVITGVEAEWGIRYTADLIRHMKRVAPTARFVWIMGSDNLRQLHRWQAWREIAERVPVAVVNRPGSLAAALAAPAAQLLSRYRIDEMDAPLLADLRPPAWLMLTGPRSELSSTALRSGAAVS